MILKGFETLACRCGGQDFVSVVQLQFKDGAGTIHKNNGFYCVKCLEKADTGKMVSLAKKANAIARLKEVEAEIDSHG